MPIDDAVAVNMLAKGIDLQPGDYIASEGSLPVHLFRGRVNTVTAIDAGVQIDLNDGRTFVRTEDHPFWIRREGVE